MDEYGQLPLSLGLLDARLQTGHTYQAEGFYPNGVAFRLSLRYDGDRYIVEQDSDEYRFQALDTAVLTLINCLGSFTEHAII